MPVACARHILVKTEQEASKIKQLLAQGADFGQLAKKHSKCPSAKKGGDLGEFRPGQMVKAIDTICFRKKELEIHGPVKTQFGFHLVQVIYRR